MRVISRFVVASAACVFVSRVALSEEKTIHSFTVAANAALSVTNKEVDDIIATMNAIMATHRYAGWDKDCPGVVFQRVGDVINIKDANKFPLSGTFVQLQKAMHDQAPTANVMIVSGINCSGIIAAGCGNIGDEPLIVGLSPGFDAQLWLHERGHNMGLEHSAEAPTIDTDTTQDIGMRFMFWRLGVGHLGKNADECSHFESIKFASTKASNVAAAAVAAADATAPQSQGAASPPLSASSPATALPSDPAVEAARNAGLTDSAFKVVGPPWLEPPIAEIKAMTKSDLDSIRSMLAGNPNQFWPQAIQALAIAGNADDLPIIVRALKLPMAAIGPDAKPEDVQQFRNLINTKLAAPSAIGILANRTKSSAAVGTLKETANVDDANKIIGPANASQLSNNAISGLVTANTPEGNHFVNSTTGAGLPVIPGLPPAIPPNIRVAPLKQDEINNLRSTQDRIRAYGLDAVLGRARSP